MATCYLQLALEKLAAPSSSVLAVVLPKQLERVVQ